LPTGDSGKLAEKANVFGALLPPGVQLDVVGPLLLGGVLPCAQHHFGMDGFAPFRVRAAQYRAHQHCRAQGMVVFAAGIIDE
jgi:hypothetical protein